ncbi:ABC transporter ATP-binding protein [Alloscardovia omnicolens]|jgi:macrolide export ATP-binding/permease protein macB|nr:ABC transporter ATP-binding protein [Alloscardovia omnicolens]KWZ73822.1 ABC transporter, ATP-binding protein [Alloscardovia omnicolens]MBS6346080.1 ABC transporter ATP-binding protein [Alloscardovia omnicolens]MDK6249107.1 ABC transporter ATP-binding protein [Alloscardovia omnicolens]MDK6444597.1 ABC transporter ATP-binding protein [Alloscardovia omnicolens]MDK6521710.1 ABC transporter ATP-binding protein [Alloscardovia omnicolens]
MNTTLQNQSVPEVKSPVVSLSDVTKIYGRGDTRVRALKGIDLVINKGEFTSIMGPSGSGKSTMLHVIAGLDNPTKGVVTVDGIDITHLKDKELTELRRSRIGFIFQSFNLVPTLNVEDNILLPMQLSNQKIDKEWMSRVVQVLGLSDRLKHRPSELSGGQQQRVAVARALVARPAIIVADEPTGNLDSKTSDEVLSILRQAVDEFGQSVIMVTHNPAVASVSDRVIVVSDGFIKADMVGATPDQVVSLL